MEKLHSLRGGRGYREEMTNDMREAHGETTPTHEVSELYGALYYMYRLKTTPLGVKGRDRGTWQEEK